jgi:hypothetical protein
VSSTGRRLRRLSILGALAIALWAWRNRMIARNEHLHDEGSTK